MNSTSLQPSRSNLRISSRPSVTLPANLGLLAAMVSRVAMVETASTVKTAATEFTAKKDNVAQRVREALRDREDQRAQMARMVQTAIQGRKAHKAPHRSTSGTAPSCASNDQMVAGASTSTFAGQSLSAMEVVAAEMARAAQLGVLMTSPRQGMTYPLSSSSSKTVSGFARPTTKWSPGSTTTASTAVPQAACTCLTKA